MPVNLNTINAFYQINLDYNEAVVFLEKVRAKDSYENPINLEQKVISQIGRDLYEALIRGYTFKQWGKNRIASLRARLISTKQKSEARENEF